MVCGAGNHRLDGQLIHGNPVGPRTGDVHESCRAGRGVPGVEPCAYQHVGTGHGLGLGIRGKAGHEFPVVAGCLFLQQVREPGNDGVGDNDAHGRHQRGVVSRNSGWMLCM